MEPTLNQCFTLSLTKTVFVVRFHLMLSSVLAFIREVFAVQVTKHTARVRAFVERSFDLSFAARAYVWLQR